MALILRENLQVKDLAPVSIVDPVISAVPEGNIADYSTRNRPDLPSFLPLISVSSAICVAGHKGISFTTRMHGTDPPKFLVT